MQNVVKDQNNYLITDCHTDSNKCNNTFCQLLDVDLQCVHDDTQTKYIQLSHLHLCVSYPLYVLMAIIYL